MRNTKLPQNAYNDLDTQIDAYLHSSELEQVDKPDQQLAQRLQKYYQLHQEHELVLKRVQLRLEHFQNAMDVAVHSEDEQGQVMPPLTQLDQFKASHPESRRRFSRALNLLAAVVVVVFLVGSVLVVLSQAHTPATGVAGHSPKTQSSSKHAVQPPHLYALSTDFGNSNDFGERTLSQVDPASGKTNWHFTIKPTIETGGNEGSSFSSLQAVDGVLYFLGSDTHGTAVYAVQEATGTLVWKFLLGEDYSGNLVIANGLVYTIQSQTKSEVIVALDAQTGSLVWQRGYMHSSTVGGGDTVQIVGSQGNALYAIDYQYAQDRSTLYALNAQKGTPLWQQEIAQLEEITLGQIAGNTLYLAGQASTTSSPQDQTLVYAYDLSTGKQDWSKAIGGRVTQFDVAQNVIYAVTGGKNQYGSLVPGTIYALRASDGLILWQQPLNLVISAMVVVNGEVYLALFVQNAAYSETNGEVSGPNWYLEALRGSDGHMDWQKSMGPEIGSQPVILGSDLYLTSSHDTIDVFNLSRGELIGTMQVSGLTTSSTPSVMLFAA